jgi:hypothetical protein
MADITGRSTSIWNIKMTSKDIITERQDQRRRERLQQLALRASDEGKVSIESDEEKDDQDDDLKPYLSIHPKVSQLLDSPAKDLVQMTEVYEPTAYHDQPEVQLLRVIIHDSLEASSMELRINFLGTHSSNQFSAVLYIGMSNGVIQKHTINDLC